MTFIENSVSFKKSSSLLYNKQKFLNSYLQWRLLVRRLCGEPDGEQQNRVWLGGFTKWNRMCFRRLNIFWKAIPSSSNSPQERQYNAKISTLISSEWTSCPKYIEYLKKHFISFCETSEWYPTLLLTMIHQVPSPLSLHYIGEVIFPLEVLLLSCHFTFSSTYLHNSRSRGHRLFSRLYFK